MLAKNLIESAGNASEPNYIESVFSTYLYTGTGATLSIVNNIDLATKGGMTWIKSRSSAFDNNIFDTTRGANSFLVTNTEAAADSSETDRLTAFNADGFSIGVDARVNASTSTYVSWTWRKQPKFFDIQTWTGTGSARTIAHNLGSVPGCIIVKRTNSADGWRVYHRANTAAPETDYLVLNDTAATVDNNTIWNDTPPTSTVFTVGTGTTVNENGGTYVAYIFAHNAGGFGLTGTDNVISCGSFTTDGSGNATVNLGYEPQWLMHKVSSTTGNWAVTDNMRGMDANLDDLALKPNLSNAEAAYGAFKINATGFTATNLALSATYIYIAIRRGPMKVPTDATKVFKPTTTAGTGVVVNTTFPVDMNIYGFRSGNINSQAVNDRLRGVTTTATQASSPTVKTAATDAENLGIATVSWDNTGFTTPTTLGVSLVHWSFRRAPSFFDEVCYTGNQTVRALNHNLGVAPELIFLFQRSPAANVYARLANPALLGSDKWLYVNQTDAVQTSTNIWANTAPTATTFTVGASTASNITGTTYVAYLFATCAGVSKVGSYTGNGTSQTINCGFTGGARFILIKRTNLTEDWYVWDSARGIIAGNDPSLRLNVTNSESTTYDSIDPDSSGFIVNQNTSENINVNGSTYIFLAIA